MLTAVKGRLKAILPASLYEYARSSIRGVPYVPPTGSVRFGSLRRLSPLSRRWGRDRGRAIDRYYIENFLEAHRADIRGRVLEIGDNTYTLRFGGDRVTTSDVLHVDEGHAGATIVADLTGAEHVAGDQFDCIVFTQTLQFIFDAPAALRTLHRILKPGGVLLCTVPGITHTGDRDWGDNWCWSFTRRSMAQLLEREFEDGEVRIEAYGNVLTASAFLYGLAEQELTRIELDHHDPAYEMVIAARAVKESRGRE
jgi:SAM-dependent methyltransferase